jgi:(p)ppGpp synthase/HD superfamily hydrolase
MRNEKIQTAELICIGSHVEQERKYTGEPYHVHPLRVAELVSQYTGDIDTICAAYLHDVFEDCPHIDTKIILNIFGSQVYSLVYELTNQYTKELHPELNRKDRKRLEQARLANISNPAKLIKLCDRLDNIEDLIYCYRRNLVQKDFGPFKIGSKYSCVCVDYQKGIVEAYNDEGDEVIATVNIKLALS